MTDPECMLSLTADFSYRNIDESTEMNLNLCLSGNKVVPENLNERLT